MPAAAVYDISRSRSMYSGAAPGRRRESVPFDVEYALGELSDAEAEKNQLVSAWRSAIDLFMPNRQGFNGEQKSQPRIPQEKFDSAPEESLKRGVANVLDAFVPDGQQWSEVTTGAGVSDKDKRRFAEGLEQITEVTFDHVSRSRFSTEVKSAGRDMFLSTMFLAIDPGTREMPFRIRAASLDECFPVLGPDGAIENVHRRYKCRPQHIQRDWPAADLGPRVRGLIDQKSRDRITVVESTTFEPGRGFRFTVFDPADKWVFYDVEPDDVTAPPRWITPRMDVFPEFAYGCGPLITALAACRTLNKTQDLGLKALAKILAPPTLFDKRAGINPNTVRLGANMVGMFDGTQLGGAAPFAQMPIGGNPQVSADLIREHRAIIDDILFATPDIPPAEEFKGRTMYETMVRRQMVLAQRGASLGILRRELQEAAMRRFVYILGKFRLIPQLRIDGELFAVQPLGPVAAAQRAEKARAKLSFIADARAAAGDQVVALQLKVEDMIGNAARDSPGVEESEIRDDGEKEQIQKQAAQVAAMQAAGQGPSLDPSNLPGLGS